MNTNPIPSMTDEQCWRAVVERDPGGDGRFVYAVRSTGIFCRPSCPSRRAGRDQVSFYALFEAAARAGYRPCKRCRPERAEAAHPDIALVRRVCRSIEEHDEGAPTLSELGVEMGVSPHHLQRLFTSLMGLSPRRYADAVRLGRLKRGLKDGESVASALYGAGYGSSSRLYEKAPSRLGMTPASYAKGGRGARVAYAVVDHAGLGPLGLVLVAATERGVCMVALGSSERELEKDLFDEFPHAVIRRDDAGLSRWAAAVAELAEGNTPRAELPLDIRVTAFQWRVFEHLSAIPAGETRSYGEIAAAMGQPGAARAVGRACATNPIAVVVPCHRAVGANGSLHGYRWGLDRKKTLLDRERGGGKGS
jgi:AraC family transcriptional regulator of adaptative response/methylated-DNA-[protein]-cysteine methyltransferase